MPQNFEIVANILLETLDENGNVLDSQEGHNLVVNDGIDWMTRRIWGGLSGLPDPVSLNVANFAIILGNGDGATYIPRGDNRALKMGTIAKMHTDADPNLDLSVPNSLPVDWDLNLTFTGMIAASDVQFHVREMGLGIAEAGGQQVTVGMPTNYRMLNISSNPPNRDYSGNTAATMGTIRGTVSFRLVAGN